MRARLTWALLCAAFAVAALAGLATEASAQIPGDTIKIGVLSDFSGPFADQVGKGSEDEERSQPPCGEQDAIRRE